MPINPSIALQVRPPEIESPLNALAKVTQVQNAMNQNRLFDMQVAESQRKQQRQNALMQATRNAFDTETKKINPDKYRGALAEIGDFEGLQSFEKSQADLNKVQRQAEKERLIAAREQVGLIGQVAGAAKDPQSYAAGLQALRNAGIDVSSIPEQYDPSYVEQARNQAITAAQQLEQLWKQKEYDLDIDKFKYQQKNDAANRDVTIRGQNMVDTRARQANTLKERELNQSKESGLPVLGVPVPTITPWANQSNAKDANKVKLAEINRGSKEIEKDTDAARQAAQQAQDAQRFLELNSRVDTGGVTDKVGIGRWVQSLGPDYAEMESITARLAPAQRIPGSGATSDYDAKQFERATVGVDKPKPTNTNIANAVIARSKLLQDYADFRNTYLEQNGTLQGADRYWKQYVDKNPIFDPKKSGSFDLNAARKDWREYFAGRKEGAGRDNANPGNGGAQPGGLTPEEQRELEELRTKFGGRNK